MKEPRGNTRFPLFPLPEGRPSHSAPHGGRIDRLFQLLSRPAESATHHFQRVGSAQAFPLWASTGPCYRKNNSPHPAGSMTDSLIHPRDPPFISQASPSRHRKTHCQRRWPPSWQCLHPALTRISPDNPQEAAKSSRRRPCAPREDDKSWQTIHQSAGSIMFKN